MKFRAQLRLEELGDRIVPSSLSHGWGTAPVGHGALFRHAATQHHHLAGQGSGTFTQGFANPDVGGGTALTGAGNFKGLGDVTIDGTLHAVGFLANGHATGTVTFSNAQGSVTLALTGPQQPGFSPLPTKFHYQIISGTGAYANWQDQGTLVFHQTFASPSDGTFAIAIK